MVKLKSWKVFAILFEIFLGISASTHWVVTENGRIQSQLDSPFHMRRPYDLLALVEQERRVRNIEELYKELVTRKAAIDKEWGRLEGATDLEARLYSQDSDCLQGGWPLSDTDLYVSLAGNIKDRIELNKHLTPGVGGEPALPDCLEAVELDFSMHGFQHLQALIWSGNLSSGPETALVSAVLEERDVAEFAHQVASGLQRNTTSWLHHNLAAIYWRIRGDAPSAVECARRAVHFAPREYRDLALLTLGGVLHQARASSEAAVVLHAAVDHAPMEASNHLALGTVYAALGDYNRSVSCLDNALKLQPGLEVAARIKHAVVCHRKLEHGLLELNESLQSILTELHEYHVRQEQWLKLQEKLMWQQAPLEMRLLGQDQQSLAAVLRATGQSCVQRLQGGRPTLSCDLNSDSQVLAHSLQVDFALSLQMLLKNVESQAKKISEQMARRLGHDQPLPNTSRAHPDVQKHRQRQHTLPSQPPSSFVPGNPTESEGWPSKEECTAFADKFPRPKDFPSVFLAPEARGLEVNQYLNQLIGLEPGEEHALPWYPPICSPTNVVLDPEMQRFFPPAVGRDESAPEVTLVQQLLKYGRRGQVVEAEIGQRILTAINKEAGPSWLLHTMAALYWRVRGNSRHALDCLQVALSSVPGNYRDVVLVSLGSLLLRLGHLDAALLAAEEALETNDLEPTAQFLMALVLETRGNHSGAVIHLRQILGVDPGYLGGRAQEIHRAAACMSRFEGLGSSDSLDSSSEDMCGASSGGGRPVDLLTSLESLKEGETVLCSANGEQCRAVQCFSAGQDSGGVVTLEPAAVSRLLTSGSAQCGGSALSSDQTDETELERMADTPSPKQFHVRIALGEDSALHNAPLGEFYVPVALTDDAWLHVYDKSGTYPLSPGECERIKNVDWGQQIATWLSSATGGITIERQLPPLPPGVLEVRQPECDTSLPPSPLTLDHLSGVRLRHRLQCAAESGLASWLSAVAGEQGSSSSLQELGTRIALALQENATSWMLATAAALYWRVMGQADHAVTCLRQALQYAPSPDKNIPLLSLANVLHRAGFYNDALVVANMALELAPKFEIAHFTLANIHASMGDLEKAIGYYRSSLALQPEFEPARNRLQSILCSLLFEEQSTRAPHV
ncbi:tetratricopeptide repeat protein 17 [Anabrus simplex]|uniref:tetratricopeptide repeat protein 17 n=1 Tax=Anabrus simplex TaxID=316456 RepID=UPI0034DDB3CE